MELTRQVIEDTRTALGPTATFAQVAKKLGVGENSVRRMFTEYERQRWTRQMRSAKRKVYLAREAKRVKASYLATGQIPTARQSGVSSYAMRLLGGYNVIMKAAGFHPRSPGRPRSGLKSTYAPKGKRT